MELKQQNIIDPFELELVKAKTTPMMKQYLEVKSRHQEYLLFYRMGDFYELFFDDAKIASKELGIALTKRGKYNDEDIPMCGVPYHSAQTYISRIIKSGHKIAIAEQFEDKFEIDVTNKHSKIISRDVVKIITPGTLMEEQLLDSKDFNYLVGVYVDKGNYCVSWLDMTTGIFNLTYLDNEAEFKDILFKIEPCEIITTERIQQKVGLKEIFKIWNDKVTYVSEYSFDRKNNEEKLKRFFGLESLNVFSDLNDLGISTAGSLINYLQITQKNNVPNILKINVVSEKDYLEVDQISNESLEIFRKKNGEKRGSLIDILDRTMSSGGARMLRNQLKMPLKCSKKIEERLNFVDAFFFEDLSTSNVRAYLKNLPDMDRTLSRISAKVNNPRDMLIVSNFIDKSLGTFREINSMNKEIVKKLVFDKGQLELIYEVKKTIDNIIKESCPANLNEGDFIKEGVSNDLDKLRNIKKYREKEVLALQKKYSEDVNVPTLKIKFNNIHGFFIEVSKKNSHKLIQDKGSEFQLIQNTTNSSRFLTPKLKEISIEISTASSKAIEIEKKLYQDLSQKVINQFILLNAFTQKISFIDVITNYAYISKKRNYNRPSFSGEQCFEIVQGRHPIVENSYRKTSSSFVANDCILNNPEKTILMTGPNMAGKSTYLRQVAIIIIMAQMGCFVPAEACKISCVDKIYTRIGASDDLSQGLSTFMTEMIETARMLIGASENSLIILDELGRGTSNSDGLSLAWAILEYIVKRKKCLTLFATHYKELTNIKSNHNEIKLKTLETKNWNDEIIFMYKVIDGISKSSYGIHVAKLSGVPIPVIKRAKEILKSLNDAEKNKEKISEITTYSKTEQDIEENYVALSEIKKIFLKIEPDQISPKDALDLLYEIKKKLS